MWASINKVWQVAFEQGWEAFINGSVPIGAVITDENDNVISYGRNRLYEKGFNNPKIAHAEMEAIRELDTSKYPNVYTYTLYTSMEPCPMCLGTFVMSNLRKLRVAARDGHCGATHYCNEDPYMISKKIKVDFELGILETVQLVMQTYFMLKKRNGEMDRVTDKFEQDNPTAIKIAKAFYGERYLDQCVENKLQIGDIFDKISELAE